MTFEIRPSKMTSFGRFSVSKIVADSLSGRLWSVKNPELICLHSNVQSPLVWNRRPLHQRPTFPAVDFWYLEFYDLRNKIFIFHHLKQFNIQQNSLSFLLDVNYSVRGHNYVWTLRYFSWCVAFLNRRDVLSNDLFVQIVRFILPIMISIYFHINNSTNMIMNEWDLTFMIGLVQFHSKTSTGWGIMDQFIVSS